MKFLSLKHTPLLKQWKISPIPFVWAAHYRRCAAFLCLIRSSCITIAHDAVKTQNGDMRQARPGLLFLCLVILLASRKGRKSKKGCLLK